MERHKTKQSLIWAAAILACVGCTFKQSPETSSSSNVGANVSANSNMPPIVIVNADGQAVDKAGRPISEAGLRRMAPFTYVAPTQSNTKEVYVGSE